MESWDDDDFEPPVVAPTNSVIANKWEVPRASYLPCFQSETELAREIELFATTSAATLRLISYFVSFIAVPVVILQMV